MSTQRRIVSTIAGQRAIDGAGVRLIRVVGHSDVKEFDPFLLLDAFDSKDPKDYTKGFPWHPHRGIETFTYLVEGLIEHGDSLGNKGLIRSGDAQWMTAGSGIIHQEMPKASDRMLGLQLWVNLPKKEKMCDPVYRDLTMEHMVEIDHEGSHVRLIAGEYAGRKVNVDQAKVDVRLMDLQMDEGTSLTIDLETDHTLFLYVYYGRLQIEGTDVQQRCAVLLGEGDQVTIHSLDASRFMWFQGKKLKEPIAWGGPIVMNTREELDLAFTQLNQGTFLKR
ncbi:MAG TPA: pirin family protein [Erysipelotrichaceae bacterium]|nr:pirin family protein [Erysipelotrichaceae bacterium]